MANKTGYVNSYKLEIHDVPPGAPVYFTVTVTDDAAGTSNPADFVLTRNIISTPVDTNTINGEPWAISYGNVHQAIIATFKDALLHRKQVVVDAFDGALGGEGEGAPYSRIRSVQIRS